jgi:hypothetical protein
MNIIAAIVKSLQKVENGSLMDVLEAVRREVAGRDVGNEFADALGDLDTDSFDPDFGDITDESDSSSDDTW